MTHQVLDDGVLRDATPGEVAEIEARQAEAQAAGTARSIKRYDGIVQGHIDAIAQSFGYGDPNRPTVSPILHAISYADEPEVPKFQAEGKMLRAWRSRVWATAATILKQVTEGQRSAPSEADLLAELPAAPTINDLPPELR